MQVHYPDLREQLGEALEVFLAVRELPGLEKTLHLRLLDWLRLLADERLTPGEAPLAASLSGASAPPHTGALLKTNKTSICWNSDWPGEKPPLIGWLDFASKMAHQTAVGGPFCWPATHENLLHCCLPNIRSHAAMIIRSALLAVCCLPLLAHAAAPADGVYVTERGWGVLSVKAGAFQTG